MTPVALWTGRLPGLRPLPSRRALWAVAGIVAFGMAGTFGLLGPQGIWLGIIANLAAGWTIWRHRWPTSIPRGLRPLEAPEGPDERAVVVEFRQEGALLGWDVGILWFERGGVGFVGRTVSFVLPRALMAAAPDSSTWGTALRAPQMTAKVFATIVGIVPLTGELHAHMTLARIDALPNAVTSETILPPSSMHPDLLQRGLAVQRRQPLVAFLIAPPVWTMVLPANLGVHHNPLARVILSLVGLFMFVLCLLLGTPLPSAIRTRLPKESRPRKH